MSEKPSPSQLAAASAPDADAQEHTHPDDLRLQREVLRAVENAGIHGLCREGQRDIAVDMVKVQRPDWADGTVLAFVRHVMAQRL